MRSVVVFGSLVLSLAACGGSSESGLFNGGEAGGTGGASTGGAGNSSTGGGSQSGGAATGGGSQGGSAGAGAGTQGGAAGQGAHGGSAGQGANGGQGGSGQGGSTGGQGGSGQGGSTGGQGGSGQGGSTGGQGGSGQGGSTGGQGGSTGGQGGGTTNPEVLCGGTSCEITNGQLCCVPYFSFPGSGPTCEPSGDCRDFNQDFSTDISCDGPEDCPGQICCGTLTQIGGGGGQSTEYDQLECANSCDGQDEVVICGGDDSVCEADQVCAGSDLLDGYLVCRRP